MRQPLPGTRLRVVCVSLPLLLGAAPVFAATAPTPGSILQQTTPPPALPSVPRQVIALPAPAQQRSRSAVKIPVSRIVLSGNHLVPTADLRPLLAGLEGHTVTLGQLQAGAARITRYYRARGHALAYAYLPAQKIADGVVKLVVVEPRYDRIAIQNHSSLKTAQVRRTLGLHAGASVEQGPLERGLLLLDQTPGIRVAGTLVPGARPGTSSLRVRVGSAPRLAASVGMDNQGNSATGRVRVLAAASISNPFGYGSELAVNGMASEGGLLDAGGIDLTSPDLYHGLRASLYGSRTRYRLGGAFAALGQSGSATQYGLGLNAPLVLEPGRSLGLRLDLLRSRFVQQSGTAGLNDRSHIDLVRLGLSGAVALSGGASLSGGISVAHGRLVLDTLDAIIADNNGPHAAGGFTVTRFRLRQAQPLPHAFALTASLSGQLASRNLDSSQQFYLGGPTGVGSAAVGAAGGDSGTLLRLRLAHRLPIAKLPGRLTAAALLQAGEVLLHHDPYGPPQTNSASLVAGGVGLDYRWGNRVSGQLAYLQRIGHSTLSRARGQLWASARLAF